MAASATASTPVRRKPRPTEPVKRLVWSKAAARCAFPECRTSLIEDATGAEPAVLLGEIAHIVGHSEDGGPRADEPVPGGEREGERNLMLLCVMHHTLIDRREHTYSAARLIAIKADHERWVREVTAVPRRIEMLPASELVHSTFLSVDTLPRHIYVAPCLMTEKDIFARIRYPHDKNQLVPCIVREKQLITFTPIDDPAGPFNDVVSDRTAAERHDVTTWLRDEDQSRWIVDLLNRSVRRALTQRGLWYDKEHRRFFFPPVQETAGGVSERSVRYRPMNQPVSERKVAWNPITKKTGLGKRY